MKISIVTGFFLPVPPVVGGAAEKIWFRLAREFAHAGHTVTHFSRTWPGFPDRESIEGITMVRLPGFNHTPSIWRNLTLDLIWGFKVTRRLPPGDIVVCNTVSMPIYLSALRPRAGRVVAILGRMPKGQVRLYGLAHRLVATSEAVRAEVVRENPRLAGRTRTILNPIDWNVHQAAKAQTPDHIRIGYVGRINPEKGLEILIDAAAQLAGRPGLPPWSLVIIGPQGVAQGGGGPAYVEELRRRASAAGGRISIEPPVYDVAALARIYGSLDIFCYPTLAEKGEGLSVAPIEAMAAGAVPVLSELDCYRDLIRPGINGFYFNHRAQDRSSQLASVLGQLITEPALRARLAAQACTDSRSFDYGAVAEALLKDFQVLAEG